MIDKKLSKLIGLKEADFISFINSNQITFSNARLIPLLKTGDEMALTSIFLSSLKLIKEFRNTVFKELKIPRSGKFYYLTEVRFPELSKNRIDGLIVVIKSGKVSDATIFEMKKESNPIDEKQMKEYISLALNLKIPRIVTISNQYVSDPSDSPLDMKVSKKISMYHFSWTYLLTLGRILLFKNDFNINDEDQVEIMREVLYYFESEKSGIQGYSKMAPEWKILTENILAHKHLKEKDPIIHKAILSWYQEEKDMALKLSRELGVFVKTKSKTKDSLKSDIKYVIAKKAIKSKIQVKDAVSDIIIEADFEKKNVKLAVDINCPETGTNTSKINWIIKQIIAGKKKSPLSFDEIFSKTYLSANIKYSRHLVTEELSNHDKLKQIPKSEEIKSFKLYIVDDFGRQFISQKGFITRIEKLLINFYDAYVQHLTNYNKPAPKIETNAKHTEELEIKTVVKEKPLDEKIFPMKAPDLNQKVNPHKLKLT